MSKVRNTTMNSHFMYQYSFSLKELHVFAHIHDLPDYCESRISNGIRSIVMDRSDFFEFIPDYLYSSKRALCRVLKAMHDKGVIIKSGRNKITLSVPIKIAREWNINPSLWEVEGVNDLLSPDFDYRLMSNYL